MTKGGFELTKSSYGFSLYIGIADIGGREVLTARHLVEGLGVGDSKCIVVNLTPPTLSLYMLCLATCTLFHKKLDDINSRVSIQKQNYVYERNA